MFRSLKIIINIHNPIFALAVYRNNLLWIVEFAVENGFEVDEGTKL